ncbi:MAG: DHH family phosphoesterase [archaeon]
MPEFSLKKIVSLCKHKNVLLLAHENADLDSFCSAAIMQRFLKKQGIKSMVGVPKHINEQAQHFAFTEKISFQVNPDLKDFGIVMLFDLNGFEQLGRLRKEFERALRKKEFLVMVFDHHVPEKKCISSNGLCVTDESCVSTTEVIYNFLDTYFDKQMNFWNCIGIVEDTGHFLVGNPKSFESFACSLKNSGKIYADVLHYAKHRAPDDERIAFLKAAQRAQIQKIGSAVVVTSELSFYQGAAATKLLDFGAHIAIVCGKEKDGLTNLSARVETEFRDKNKFNLVKHLLIPLNEKVGGEIGGHSGAAQWKGCAEPKQVFDEIFNILRKKL